MEANAGPAGASGRAPGLAVRLAVVLVAIAPLVAPASLEGATGPRGRGPGRGEPFGPLSDSGGWFTLAFLSLAELDHDRSTPDSLSGILTVDLRIWWENIVAPRRRFYVRARKLDFSFATTPGASLPSTKNQEEIDVDLAHVDQPVGKIDMRAGRQLLRVGRGLALSQVVDGLRVRFPRGHESIEGFAGRLTHQSPSVDTSILGFDTGSERRLFVGTQYERLLEQGARLLVYLFGQNDNTRSASAVQNAFDFGYDTVYAGASIDGAVDDRGRWFAEVVREWGGAFTDVPTPARIPVRASAFDAGLRWFLGEIDALSVSAQYTFGSGDPHRTGSAFGTFGARSGIPQVDSAFRGFGRIEGGLGLSPLLTNLHILRLGFEWKPYADSLEAPADMLLGSHTYLYRKDRSLGAISDPGASLAVPQVGLGTDLVLAWRSSPDVDYLVIYGLFLPGPAYPTTADDHTRRVVVAATLSF